VRHRPQGGRGRRRPLRRVQALGTGRRRRLEFADAVIDACDEENDFKFLYPLEMKLRDRVEKIAKEVYGADGVDWTPEAEAKAKMLEDDPKYADFATMMVKTH
jgi:formate--tetrahydrofolate ligase